MTRRKQGLFLALVAATFVVPAQTALAKRAGDAQFAQHQPHRFMNGRVCRFHGNRIAKRVVRRRARAAGYRRIRNIRFVRRLYGRYNWCGFYRATAMRRGRPTVIFADAHTGRVIARQRRGRIGRSYRQNMSARQVRAMLRRQGYRRVRNIRYVRRGGRDFYVARAHWRRWIVRLRIDDETGRIVNRRRLRRLGLELETPDLSRSQVRALLRSEGYREIRSVRPVQLADTAGYAAIASYDNVPFQLRVHGTTGRIHSKRRLR